MGTGMSETRRQRPLGSARSNWRVRPGAVLPSSVFGSGGLADYVLLKLYGEHPGDYEMDGGRRND